MTITDPATGTTSHGYAGQLSGAGENIQKLGQSIYTRYLLPFEMTAALLVIAVVAAVVLSRRQLPAASEMSQRRAGGGRRPNERSREPGIWSWRPSCSASGPPACWCAATCW